MQHRPLTARRRGGSDYSASVRRPLHVLLVLAPLILAYEIGSRAYLNGSEPAAVQTIRAHSVLLEFFRDFGIAGQLLPSITLVIVLLVWHVLNGDRWRVRPLALLGMTGESLALTMPLIVFIVMIKLALGGSAPAPAIQTSGADPLADLPWKAAVVISIGAGVYEEFLFRLVGMSAMHLILVDLGRMTQRVGTVLAVVLSAAAFAAYHDVMGPDGRIDIVKSVSLLAAGIYFGGVFAARGFGVAVGVHVIYDVCVLVFSAKGTG